MPEGLEQMPDDDLRNIIACIPSPPRDGTPFSWKLEENRVPTTKTTIKK